jgi:hypothetical protein
MRIVARGPVLALIAFAVLVGGEARAASNPNGIVFRAVGFFKGSENISDDQIKCEIPNLGNAIAEGAFALGLWNTFGIPTLYFPDRNSPFGNPCGGWIQLQSNLRDQGLFLEKVRLRYRIPNAGRLRAFVPTRNRWPIACRQFRNETVFLGSRINPVNSTEPSQSGAPNVVFVQMLPLVSTQLIHCLRTEYAPVPADVFTSLPLVVRTTAVATSDAGKRYESNPIRYTLTLRRTCGNGRVDDGEMCDPASVLDTCSGLGLGPCVPVGDPSECSCTVP